MKRAILVICTLFCWLGLQGQSDQKPKPRSESEKMERVLERMTQRLDLQAEQQAQLEPILRNYLRQERQRRQEAQQYRAALRDSLQGVLSPEQWEKLKKQLNKRRQQMPRGKGSRQGR